MRLSLKRFREEKLWERKFEAYTKIVIALHALKQYTVREESYDIGELNIESTPKEELAQWRARFGDAEEELMKFKETGALILPDAVIALIAQFHKTKNTVYGRNDWEQRDVIYEAVDSCMKAVIAIAKKDLKSAGGDLLSFVISRCPTSAPR